MYKLAAADFFRDGSGVGVECGRGVLSGFRGCAIGLGGAGVAFGFGGAATAA